MTATAPSPPSVRRIDAPVAHGQIVAFDQFESEIPREIGVFEIGFVVGSRREEHGVAFVRTGEARHRFAELPEERRQPLHAEFAEQFGNVWLTTTRFSSA